MVYRIGAKMEKVATDYLTEDTVILSDIRGDRPNLYKNKDVHYPISDSNYCPFCLENKDYIDKEILSSKDNTIRIVANKYPALSLPKGLHDVVIDTKVHDENIFDFSNEHILLLLETIQKRVLDIYENESIKYIQVFKNSGMASGASIPHSHWQILGMDYLPKRQLKIWENYNNYYLKNLISYNDYIYSLKDLIIYENNHSFIYAPEVSIFSYITRITTKKNNLRFENMNSDELYSLGDSLKKLLNGLRKIHGDFSFNICFQIYPKLDFENYGFYMEIIPRLGNFAGFEMSTDCYINHIPAKLSAKKLKETIK